MRVKAVLVIDDDKRTRESLRMLMELEGFIVDCCDSGFSAQERLQEMSFDLILIDYQMPEIVGTEVTRSVRDLCPDAFIFGMSIENKRLVFLNAGADDFINKERLVLDLPRIARQRLHE
jgi:two-component system response regulator ResD